MCHDYIIQGSSKSSLPSVVVTNAFIGEHAQIAPPTQGFGQNLQEQYRQGPAFPRPVG